MAKSFVNFRGAQELLSVEEKFELTYLSMAGIILLFPYTDHIGMFPLSTNFAFHTWKPLIEMAKNSEIEII